MRQHAYVLLGLLVSANIASAKTATYNKMTTVNLRDQGLCADERSTNVLLARGNVVYGATSGERCYVLRFDPNQAPTAWGARSIGILPVDHPGRDAHATMGPTTHGSATKRFIEGAVGREMRRGIPPRRRCR